MNEVTCIKSKTFYQWLLAQRNQGNLSQKQFDALLIEYNSLLQTRVREWNKGKSTSLSRTHFRFVQENLDYLLLHAVPTSYDITTCTLMDLYTSGTQRCIQDCHKIAIYVHEILHYPLPFPNEYYQRIKKQLQEFIRHTKSERAYFYMSFLKDDFDYPLLDGLPLFQEMYGLTGSDFVVSYVRRLRYEMRLVKDYRADLPTFYQALEEQWHHPLSKIMFNLCEVLLLQLLALFCLKKTNTLILQEIDIQRLYSMREHKELFMENLQQAFAQILHPYPKAMQAYFYPFAPDFFTRLLTQDLSACLIHEHQQITKVQVQFPQSCLRNQFLNHLQHLASCSTQAKLSYLQKHISSPYDLIDLFSHGALQEEEFLAYLHQCPPLQICFLFHLMEPELFSFYPNFTFQENLDDLVANEPWHAVLLQYVSSLQPSDQRRLEKMIASIAIISASSFTS